MLKSLKKSLQNLFYPNLASESYLQKRKGYKGLNLDPRLDPSNRVDGITPKTKLSSLLNNTHSSIGLTQPLHYVSPKKKAATTNLVLTNQAPREACSSISQELGKQLMKEGLVYRFSTQKQM